MINGHSPCASIEKLKRLWVLKNKINRMNYILTYPRTGSSYIRYCVEMITNRKTLDCGGRYDKITDAQDVIILRKEHFIGDLSADNVDKLILSIRDYKDVYISHNLRTTDLSNTAKIYDSLYNNRQKSFKQYYDLIEFYDKFKGDKMIIYYEDLIDENQIIIDIVNFLLPDNEFNMDLEMIEKLSEISKNNYKKVQGLRTEKVKKLHTVLTDEQNNNIDVKFRIFNEIIYDKYLTRYLYKTK